jgi:hypothetical protein
MILIFWRGASSWVIRMTARVKVPYESFPTMHGPRDMLGTGSAPRWEGLQWS